MQESKIKIISPTYKRAGQIKAIKYFKKDLILACHKFEVKDYRKAYPHNKIMVIPDNKKGNMAKVRNHIKNNCHCKYMLMIDDDVDSIGFYEKNS